MPRIVSAAEADRQFTEILGRAVAGETVVITHGGRPIARLTAIDADPSKAVQDAAWDRLLGTLEAGLSLGGHRFDRESLYDR